MSPLTLKRRGKATDASDSQSPSADSAKAGLAQSGPAKTQQWTGGSALSARVATGLLMTCLVAGPVGVVLALRPAPTPVTVATNVVAWQESSVAAERARLFVETWLGATRDSDAALAALYGGPTGTLPRTATPARQVAVAAVHASSSDRWAVTVAADVQGPPSEGEAEEGAWVRQYFTVPVATTAVDGGVGVQILGLPAPVAAPQSVDTVKVDYSQTLTATGSLGESVSQFIGALTAGQGDIARYTSPGTTIAAITPAPYTAVKIRSLTGSDSVDDSLTPTEGALVDVQVLVELTRPDGEITTAQYGLQMAARAGRWEVAAVTALPITRSEAETTAAPAADQGENHG